MKQKYLNTLVTLILPLFIIAQASNDIDNGDLQSTIDKVLEHKIFNHANASIAVVNLNTNAEIAGHRSQKVLSPASSLKLFSTLSGIHYLGQDYRFKTVIGYKGKLQNDGNLYGDIIIKGGGDPTLGSELVKGSMSFVQVLKHIVQVISDAGISCINGNIIVDESVFDSYPVAPSWQWNDLGNYYASGAWGLNVHENQYFVHFKNLTTLGQRPKIHSVEPKVPQLKLSNELVIDSSHTGDQAYIFGGPYNYDKRIVGTLPQRDNGFRIKGSIPDPPMFFANHLKKVLDKASIQSEGIKTLFRPTKQKYNPLDTILSPPLTSIVRMANLKSNNLYTEAIVKMIGLEKRGQGSGQNGMASVKQLLRKCKVSTEGLHFHDGSGLSSRNLISAEAFAQFLSGITKYIPIDELITYLPKGGYTGTVRGMFGGSKARGHVWLKSGSMEGVLSYTGLVHAKNDQWYSFSIIVNGFTAPSTQVRASLEKIITAIYAKAA